MRRRIAMLLLLPCLRFSGPTPLEAQTSSPETGKKADFFVSPEGDDSWSGTLPAANNGKSDGPFASFDKARASASDLYRAASHRGRKDPIVVMFRAGDYFLNRPVAFSAKDSGSAKLPIVYQNYPGESPTISGGMRVRHWTKAGDGERWQTTLPASILYFEQLFYNGQRRLRPRLGGYLGKYYRIAASVSAQSEGDPNCSPDPAVRGRQGLHNRGPQAGQTPGRHRSPGRGPEAESQSPFQCFDRFQYDASDPVKATWENLKPPYPEGDIELYDFERWTVPKLRIKSIDAGRQIIYFTGPTERIPGVTGFFPHHRYIIENVKDAFTEPGQWFLDRVSSPWTLTYRARPGENPNTDRVIIPQQPQVLVAQGLEWVTFKGLRFAHDNFTIPSRGYSSPRQDMPITGAVACLNCQNVTFDGDVITQTSGGGLEFKTTGTEAMTAHNSFQNGAIYDVGSYGIRVGLMPSRTDTDNNVPHFITISDNVIAGYGRVFPVGFGVLQGQGHDNLYTHNEIYDGYHSGIEICALNCPPAHQNSHGAFNNVISFNHVHDLSLGVMNETACIYLNTSTPFFVPTGNKVLNNKCHDISDASTIDHDGYAGHGIYLDNFTGAVDVENNLVYRVASTALSMSSGPATPNTPNTIKNNIFAYARLRMLGINQAYEPHGECPASPVLKFDATNNIFLFSRGANSRPPFVIQAGCSYSCGFPYPQYQDWNSNIYWRTDGSFARDDRAFHVQPQPGEQACDNRPGAWTFYTFKDWQAKVGEDSESLVKNPGFKDPTYPADDYSLPGGSPGAGFVVFDPNQAGRTNPRSNPSSNPMIRVPSVDETFPTQPYNPGKDYE
jgi:Right handed beta helix region